MIILNIEIVDPLSPVETFLYRCIVLAAFVFWCIVQRIAFLILPISAQFCIRLQNTMSIVFIIIIIAISPAKASPPAQRPSVLYS